MDSSLPHRYAGQGLMPDFLPHHSSLWITICKVFCATDSGHVESNCPLPESCHWTPATCPDTWAVQLDMLASHHRCHQAPKPWLQMSGQPSSCCLPLPHPAAYVWLIGQASSGQPISPSVPVSPSPSQAI